MNNIFLIGDSTCQTNYSSTYPQEGWGQELHNFINKKYKIFNYAKNGHSSKSFYDEGRFLSVEKNIKSKDYLFIQFGHNDEKEDLKRHTNSKTTYKKYLKYYVNYARSKNAIPILLSSITRRKFVNGKIINTHFDYPKEIKKLSSKEKIIFIDMNEITINYLNNLGEKKSRKLFMNFPKNKYKNYLKGKEDNTHLTRYGAKIICSLLVKEFEKNNELKKIL